MQQPFGGGAKRLARLFAGARRGVERRGGRRHLGLRDIDRQHQVARTLFAHRRGQHPIDFRRGVARAELRRRCADLARHAQKVTEVAVAQCMVHAVATLLRPACGRAHNMDHRQIFGETAGRAVDGAQFADAEGGQQRRRAATARIAVRRIGRVEFVGAADPADIPMGDHAIEKLQVIVARHAKQMTDADLLKARQQIISYGKALHMPLLSPVSGLSIRYAAKAARKQRNRLNKKVATRRYDGGLFCKYAICDPL